MHNTLHHPGHLTRIKSTGTFQILGALLLVLVCLCNTACGTASKQSSTQASLTSGPVVYTALGASDAVGVGTTKPDSQGYIPLIAHHLPQGSHLINLGISGIHLHEALQKELPIALSTNPRLVTIWLVANDFVANVSYDSYMHDLTTLLQRLHTETQASIYIANLPDLTLLPLLAHGIANTPQKKAQLQHDIQRWNAQIATLARKYDANLIDLYQENSQLTSHPEYISGDGFHPSPAGYTQLANSFWIAIRKHN